MKLISLNSGANISSMQKDKKRLGEDLAIIFINDNFNHSKNTK